LFKISANPSFSKEEEKTRSSFAEADLRLFLFTSVTSPFDKEGSREVIS
jgi:hypothetical protein